jgi:hypothetical protein
MNMVVHTVWRKDIWTGTVQMTSPAIVQSTSN